MPSMNERQRLDYRFDAMKDEYDTQWADHHQDLAKYFMPRLGRWTPSDSRDGSQKNGAIRNATGTLAALSLKSVMESGITSPDRKWVRHGIEDSEKRKQPGVKKWVKHVEDAHYGMHRRSNFYKQIGQLFLEQVIFGPGAMVTQKDVASRSFRCRTFTAGEYYYSKDFDGRLSNFSRQFEMTHQQMMEKFGDSGMHRCHDDVVRLYGDSDWLGRRTIRLMLEKNDNTNGRRVPAGQFGEYEWRIVYWDEADTERYLGVDGYYERPVVVAGFWEVPGQAYPWSPAMNALADTKSLQHATMELRKQIELISRPPMWGGPGMNMRTASIKPGARNSGGQAFGSSPALMPVLQLNPDIQAQVFLIQELQANIREALHHNQFFAVSSRQGQPETAEAIRGIIQERNFSLGPVMTLNQADLLDPHMDNVYGMSSRWVDEEGEWMLPPVPEALKGEDLELEYINLISQSQKSVGLDAIARVLDVGMMLNSLKGTPEAGFSFNTDDTMRQVAEMAGTPPEIFAEREEAAQALATFQQMQAAQAGAATSKDGASAAKDLSEASIDEGTMLQQLISQAQGQQVAA